ncbi:MAG: radical SAM protein [Candidatus Aenigmatarchaeota archaeon]
MANKQIFLPVIGIACNSSCIMCSVNSKKRDPHKGTTKQILKDLIRGKQEHYERIEFTGGEPTIRKDLPILIKKAQELGYKDIGISTNGILLSDKKLCENLVKAGLSTVTISLHAHNEQLNRRITRTPGVFKKTIQGIKNLTAYKELNISVVTVILRLNYKYILKIGELLKLLKITSWDITDLLPDGRAKINYKNLCVKRIELSKMLSFLPAIVNDFQSIVFFAFSPCVIPPELLYNKKISVITDQQKVDVEKPIRYNQNNNITNQFDIHRQIKTSACYQCIFNTQCGGLWSDYFKFFGDKELQKLITKYKYLIKNF